jgi:hypothetical protein
MNKKEAILLSCAIVLRAFGNPIAVYEYEGKEFTAYNVRKQAESCIALIDFQESLVSCEVTYRLQEANAKIPSYFLGITLPAFVEAADPSSDTDIIRRFNPTVEMGGKKYLPEPRVIRLRSPDERQGISAPPDTDLVLFYFQLEIGRGQRQATILVTYVQPSVRHRFIYVPFFEDRAKNSGFILDAVAKSPTARLRCATAISGTVAYAARIRIPLRHEEVIEVKVDDANRVAGGD